MTKYIALTLALICSGSLWAKQIDSTEIINKYAPIADKIIKAAMEDTSAYESLAYMCDTFGPRLSGSDNLEKALDWMFAEMKKDGLANVRTEDVMVPHWVRHSESCNLLTPRKARMPVSALGGSIGTPKDGLKGEVIVVKSFEELEKRAAEAKGKFVLFNKPYLGYGDAVQFRVHGAVAVSKAGGMACLIRSVSPHGMQNPHTGVMAYKDSVDKVPAAAITEEDAAMIERMVRRGQNPVVELFLDCETLPDSKSRNVMGELKGTEIPDQVLALGGHSDSWDVGTGAHDDGSGCITTWKAVKLLQNLGLAPKRTLRAVMFVNEENGTRGGQKYAENHAKEEHVALFEFDSGVFEPSGIGFSGPDSLFKIFHYAEPLFRKIDSMDIKNGGGGVDIGPMVRQNKLTAMSLNTRDRDKYFWYHHSNTDTVDKVDPKDFNKCIAAIALAVYIYADL